MLDWLITFILLFIGFIVMVTGLIQVLYIGWLAYLLIMVVLWVLARILMVFENPKHK